MSLIYTYLLHASDVILGHYHGQDFSDSWHSEVHARNIEFSQHAMLELLFTRSEDLAVPAADHAKQVLAAPDAHQCPVSPSLPPLTPSEGHLQSPPPPAVDDSVTSVYHGYGNTRGIHVTVYTGTGTVSKKSNL